MTLTADVKMSLNFFKTDENDVDEDKTVKNSHTVTVKQKIHIIWFQKMVKLA